jgi:hypothetical protein
MKINIIVKFLGVVTTASMKTSNTAYLMTGNVVGAKSLDEESEHWKHLVSKF